MGRAPKLEPRLAPAFAQNLSVGGAADENDGRLPPFRIILVSASDSQPVPGAESG